jgi:hypothetical protein
LAGKMFHVEHGYPFAPLLSFCNKNSNLAEAC